MSFRRRLLFDSGHRYSNTMKKICISISLLLSALWINAQGAHMNLTGNASEVNSEFYNIDLVNGANQTGGAWYPQSFNLDSSFFLDLYIDFGNLDAEGMAIVLHTDSIPVGTGSEQLGVPTNGSSFIAEFDLFQNGSTTDGAVPHASFFKNGSLMHQSSDLLQNGTLTPGLNNGEQIRISWNPQEQKFLISRQGCTNTLLNYIGDIKNTIFGGNSKVFLGFTASTSTTADKINVLLNYNSDGLSSNTSICQGEEVMLYAYNTVPTDWSSTGAFTTTSNEYEILAQPTTTTYYKVSHLGFCGTTEDSIRVEVLDTLEHSTETIIDEASETADIILNIENEIDLAIIEWTLPDLSTSNDQSLISISSGTYQAVITSENQCTSNITVVIPPFTGEKDDPEISDPNVSIEDYFSPNGDGDNDLVLITVSGESQIIDFQGKVLKTVNEGNYWNGTADNGELLPSGVYVVVGETGKQVITLLR